MSKGKSLGALLLHIAPFIFGMAGLFSFYIPSNLKFRAERDLANPVLTMISITTAITITSFTIFISETDRTFRHHKSELKDLINDHVYSIYFGVLTCISCFFVIFFHPNVTSYEVIIFSEFEKWVFTIWFSLTILSISLFLRVIESFRRLTNKVLHIAVMNKTKDTESKP